MCSQLEERSTNVSRLRRNLSATARPLIAIHPHVPLQRSEQCPCVHIKNPSCVRGQPGITREPRNCLPKYVMAGKSLFILRRNSISQLRISQHNNSSGIAAIYDKLVGRRDKRSSRRALILQSTIEPGRIDTNGTRPVNRSITRFPLNCTAGSTNHAST
jgi:hypothetical protein